MTFFQKIQSATPLLSLPFLLHLIFKFPSPQSDDGKQDLHSD